MREFKKNVNAKIESMMANNFEYNKFMKQIDYKTSASPKKTIINDNMFLYINRSGQLEPYQNPLEDQADPDILSLTIP